MFSILFLFNLKISNIKYCSFHLRDVKVSGREVKPLTHENTTGSLKMRLKFRAARLQIPLSSHYHALVHWEAE